MRFTRHISLARPFSQLLAYSCINVLFLLFLFLLVFSPFIDQPGLRVSLPLFVTSNGTPRENVQIMVDAGGRYYYKNTKIEIKDIGLFFAALPKGRFSVLIKAEKEAPLASVMGLLELCRQSGVADAHIATYQP